MKALQQMMLKNGLPFKDKGYDLDQTKLLKSATDLMKDLGLQNKVEFFKNKPARFYEIAKPSQMRRELMMRRRRQRLRDKLISKIDEVLFEEDLPNPNTKNPFH